jgi:hypothetical protein
MQDNEKAKGAKRTGGEAEAAEAVWMGWHEC